MLSVAEKEGRSLLIYFFTHSKTTENAVKQLFIGLAKEKWFQTTSDQRLNIMT